MTGGWERDDVVAGRFRLEEQLGEGGMGEVWRATQMALDRPVALKLLRPQVAFLPGARARFEREARVTAGLAHPSIVKIHDFGEDGDRLWLAMELLRGYPLRALLDEHLPVMDVGRGMAILGQVADGLLAAHEVDLVHRDLKPENIFLEPRGNADRAVVVDFGLAFISGSPEHDRLTREGVVLGTPDYISPEQALGEEIGPPADVYALGCVLYEVLTGTTPFQGPPATMVAAHLFHPPTPPSERRRDVEVPRHLEELCLRMMAKIASERPSMEVVRGILAQSHAPAVVRRRERDRLQPLSRRARMISTIPPSPQRMQETLGMNAEPEGAVFLAVVGALSGDLSLALSANGLQAFIVSEDQPLEGAEAIYAPEATSETLSELVATGVPVITDLTAGDMDRMTVLLRVGVTEVVDRPVRADGLARKVWRAIRRHRRATGSDR
jgi:serine/threonine protein kinase